MTVIELWSRSSITGASRITSSDEMKSISPQNSRFPLTAVILYQKCLLILIMLAQDLFCFSDEVRKYWTLPFGQHQNHGPSFYNAVLLKKYRSDISRLEIDARAVILFVSTFCVHFFSGWPVG